MMKKYLALFACISLLGSCYNSPEEEKASAPHDLIAIDTTVLILADIEIAESALRQKQNYNQEISEIKEAYYYAVFTKYDVTREQFDSSMAYYRRDLKTLNSIYEKVITRLSLIESEIQQE